MSVKSEILQLNKISQHKHAWQSSCFSIFPVVTKRYQLQFFSAANHPNPYEFQRFQFTS